IQSLEARKERFSAPARRRGTMGYLIRAPGEAVRRTEPMRTSRLLAQPTMPAETGAACAKVLQRFEASWEEGPPPAIEDYLLAEPGVRRPLLFELVRLDLEFRLKTGEVARVEDYLTRYPELAQEEDAVRDLLVA